MKRVLIDTNVWSAFLRRKNPADDVLRKNLFELVESSRACIIGPIRQEVLSGIREVEKFQRLREYLEGFEDEEVTTEDYVEAARIRNLCSANGIATCSIDMTMVAFVINRKYQIYTRDNDFVDNYKKIVSLEIYQENP